MPSEVTPQKIQAVVRRGFERTRTYRRAQAMFIKEFVGRYYATTRGTTGEEPLNLLFTTLRTVVPNLVMRNPVNDVTTKVTQYKQYADLLGLALNQSQEDRKLEMILRAWIIDAFFGIGIAKTGISASGEMIQYGDQNIDPGQVYTKLVSIDDFVFDPVCTSLYESSFLGDLIHVPRQILLDTDGYNHDLVKRLPRSKYGDHKKTEEISKRNNSQLEMLELQDYVDVVELWVPEAGALATIPDPRQTTFDEYIRLTDFYGPKEGPYTFLSFTPPVPKNPLPVAPVSLLYDMHIMANRMLVKIMDQADRQKDILGYNPAVADEAEDIRTAKDGDCVAMTDPKGAQIFSYGGQDRGNEAMLGQIQMWYNYMAGNPDQAAGNMTSGTKGSKETATRSNILEGNAAITTDDAKHIIYTQTSEISKKEAWYLHTDPLIEMPLTKRTSGGEQVQLWLTPDQRQGDFLRFMFKIKAKSMTLLNPQVKSKRVMEFGTNLLPAVMNSAMIAMQAGIPFNAVKMLTNIAEEMGITEEVMDWFDDPDFEQKMMMYAGMGPQNAGKAGMAGVLQNDGNPMARSMMSPGQEMNQDAQMGANDGQSMNQGAY